MVLFSAYASHSGYAYPDRQSFYHDLGDFVNNVSAHGPKFILGDFNARLYRRLPGEEDFIGPHLFQTEEATITSALIWCQAYHHHHLVFSSFVW